MVHEIASSRAARRDRGWRTGARDGLSRAWRQPGSDRPAAQERTLVALGEAVADPAGTEIAGLRGWPLFELQSRAFVIASPSDTYASDWSAVALHGMPTKARPPQAPSVIRLGSRVSGSNLTVHGRTRFASVPDRWLTDVKGVRTMPHRRSRRSTSAAVATGEWD